NNIASVEKVHSERFNNYATMLENGSLFKATNKVQWMCTNCGYIYEGESAPAKCPVCEYTQDYYIRFNESPFEK
ncbi:MAG: rubrerythrin family protein, partial [Ligilactobacillus salivarius]|nr:rubrerythrin family protein [Ligilactobacillus salivarius]